MLITSSFKFAVEATSVDMFFSCNWGSWACKMRERAGGTQTTYIPRVFRARQGDGGLGTIQLWVQQRQVIRYMSAIASGLGRAQIKQSFADKRARICHP